MYSESLSFLTDQKTNLENVPPAENLAKVSQNSPAFSKSDTVLSSVTSQGITMSKLATVSGGENKFYPLLTGKMKRPQSGFCGTIFICCCLTRSHVVSL